MYAVLCISISMIIGWFIDNTKSQVFAMNYWLIDGVILFGDSYSIMTVVLIGVLRFISIYLENNSDHKVSSGNGD